MIQMKMNVVTIWTLSSSFKNFHCHSSGYDISGGKIFCSWSVSFHESLTIDISKNTAFPSTSFGNEATSTIDTSWMELNEFRILMGKTSSRNHTSTISSTCMSGCARLVSSSRSASGDYCLVSFHPMDGSVSHIVGHNTSAFCSLHNEIKRKVFNEENTVVTKGSSKQSVEHTVTCSVSNSATSVGLTTLAKVL